MVDAQVTRDLSPMNKRTPGYSPPPTTPSCITFMTSPDAVAFPAAGLFAALKNPTARGYDDREHEQFPHVVPPLGLDGWVTLPPKTVTEP